MKKDAEMWIKKDGKEFLQSIGMRKGYFVLDFGSGEGRYALPAAKAVGKKGRIYAVDKDKQALNQLAKFLKKNTIRNIEVINRESKTFLESNSVDFVLCYDVIHYIKNRKSIYREFYRVLKPEGTLSLYPKHHKNDYPLMELANMKLDDIIDELEKAGFSLQDKFNKRLLHDDYYNDGCILNFRKSEHGNSGEGEINEARTKTYQKNSVTTTFI
jgi:ubiquinone/menaquinone biosynthesis C-methylase UbiE